MVIKLFYAWSNWSVDHRWRKGSSDWIKVLDNQISIRILVSWSQMEGRYSRFIEGSLYSMNTGSRCLVDHRWRKGSSGRRKVLDNQTSGCTLGSWLQMGGRYSTLNKGSLHYFIHDQIDWLITDKGKVHQTKWRY